MDFVGLTQKQRHAYEDELARWRTLALTELIVMAFLLALVMSAYPGGTGGGL
jgi:hypothetical protein